MIGGSQRLWLTIAADLGKRNVALNAPVTTITQTATGVRVVSERGTFTAQRVIVAMPPALTARIRFDPQLPALRDQLVQRFPMGSYAKFEAVYDRPFWRDDGTNGQAFGDLPVNATFDQSPPDGTPGIRCCSLVSPADARTTAPRTLLRKNNSTSLSDSARSRAWPSLIPPETSTASGSVCPLNDTAEAFVAGVVAAPPMSLRLVSGLYC